MSLEQASERLEGDGAEYIEFDEVTFESTGYFSHTSYEATGTGIVEDENGVTEKYDLTLSENGESIRVRASSGEEVYLGNLEEEVADLDEFENRFEDLVARADIALAYGEGTTAYN